MRHLRGFTLLEILVVMAIVGILAAAVGMGLSGSRAASRDAQRQADLRNLQQAIEMYRQENGQYPAACNGANAWSGQVGTNFACTVAPYAGTGEYIVGLAPDYISVLPTDPRLPSGVGDAGYVYRTNATRDVYKIMAMNTVEADALLNGSPNQAYLHPFKSCALVGRDNADGTFGYVANNSICHKVYNSSNNIEGATPPDQCRYDNARFKNSYALWGGYVFLEGAGRDGVPPYNPNADGDWKGFWQMTQVICK